METEQLRVTVLECGGHVAEIVCKSAGETNPLWIQNRPTIDSDQYDPALHGAIYGVDAEARAISGISGHNLCLPFWGTPTPTEERAGMTYHGETNIVRWRALAEEPGRLKTEAILPNSQIRFEREMVCRGNLVHFAARAENLSAWDRPISWCEHVTVGPPFLEAGGTSFFSNLTRGFDTMTEGSAEKWADGPKEEFLWPEGRGEFPHRLTGFGPRKRADLVNSFLVDPACEHGYFAAWNPGLRLLFGYIFPRRDFRWMNVWESNKDERQTRGMEFSNTPIAGTMKALLRTSEIWGTPTLEWLDAKSELRKSFTAFSAVIPEDYPGVSNITVDGGKLTIAACNGGAPIVFDYRPGEN